MAMNRLGRVLRAVTVLTLACLPLAAGAATLSAQDERDVARIEAYLNTFTSLKARFLQQSSGGQFAEGWVYLSRPDRVRLDYRPPTALQIYANGYWLVYVDTELREVTHVPLSSTPAGFLVRDRVRLSGDLTVIQVDRNVGALRLHVVQTEEPEAGRVILTFKEAPLQLSHWTVIDAQGTETRVSLLDTQFNLKLDEKLFDFDSRAFEDQEIQ